MRGAAPAGNILSVQVLLSATRLRPEPNCLDSFQVRNAPHLGGGVGQVGGGRHPCRAVRGAAGHLVLVLPCAQRRQPRLRC